MIGSLRGVVETVFPPYILIDVSGVGYKVLLPIPVVTQAAVGQSLKLFTYTYVREDALELFGFLHLSDLTLFEKLIGISGIGPKTALAIFSVGKTDEIVSAITTGDVSFFEHVPRLGKKNAQKIIIELKEKLGGIGEIEIEGLSQETNELQTILKQFGFTQQEVKIALQQVKKDASVEEKLKMALQYLGK